MSQLINDTGFVPETWHAGFVSIENTTRHKGVHLASDTDPNDLDQFLNSPAIRIEFPGSHDGRGFTLARLLRLRGYQGRLRAYGALIADQYAMARRSGFDEVEIHDDLAARQPQEQWLFRSNWRDHDYQSQLKAPVKSQQSPL